MLDKIFRDPIIGFVFRFVFIFGLLIAPWPGWNEWYSHYFQQVSKVALNLGEGKRVVILESNPTDSAANGLDTRMTLCNRELLDASGKGPLKRTGLNTRSIGWVPTALTMALVIATPIPWRRRARSLLGGLVLVQAFILLTLLSWIWDNSSDLSLLTLSPFWKTAVDDLNYALLIQLGASFSVPVMIWVVVTFRRQDAQEIGVTQLAARRPDKISQTAKSTLGANKSLTTKQHQGHSRGGDGREVPSRRLRGSEAATT